MIRSLQVITIHRYRRRMKIGFNEAITFLLMRNISDDNRDKFNSLAMHLKEL